MKRETHEINVDDKEIFESFILDSLEVHLDTQGSPFLFGDNMTIADLSLYNHLVNGLCIINKGAPLI